MKRRVGVCSCLVVLMSLGCAAESDPDDIDSTFRSGGPQGGFEASYIGCDEFAGVGVVPIANVIDRVPDDYTIIEAFPGHAVVVAQAGSCAQIRVNGNHGQPGKFAQFGVSVVPPLAAGNGDFYQLMFATDHKKLASKMKQAGANAHHAKDLSYEIAALPHLDVDVPDPGALAFSLSGPIVPPNPADDPNPTAVFNYYSQNKHHENVLQQNVVEGIRLGQGQAVTLTAEGPEMQAIVGGDTLFFPFFSSPEIFDRAELMVESGAF